jgi:pimeloyl-ACP methyl ester carboxylesterase
VLLSTSQTAALLRAEGPSHLWLYKHVQRLAAWAPCEVVGQPQPWQSPAGWKVLQLLNVTNDLRGYKLPAKKLPFAAVLRQDSSPSSRTACRRALRAQQGEHEAYISTPPALPSITGSSSSEGDSVMQQHQLCSGDRLVVLLRGTGSAFEWTYNLNYTLTTDASYGPGQIHAGFHRVAEEVWGAGLQEHVAQQLAAGGISNVMFAGHSLGGAVAALLSAKVQVGVACVLLYSRAIFVPG